jgi:hypothetical protein
MCQARSEGGRRCPVHQHQNIAAIRAAEHLSGLTRLQTERLFAELRREGRNAEPLSNMLHAGSIRRIRNSVANTAVAEAVTADLELSAAHDPQIDPASAYAQRALRERAVQRGQKLNQRFLDVASRTGYSMQEVAAKYKEFRENVDTSRGSENPPEYDQNTRRAAVIADLPYDRASVVALVKLNSLVPVQEERRVSLTPAPEGSHIHSYGYDEGRMEVAFNSNPERIYAYQNVPEHVWETFSTSDSPGRIFAREIRGNDDYAYNSHDDAEADAHRVRCASCGQFRAAAHSCPEREIRAALTTTDLTAEQITELVPDRSTDTQEAEVESTVDVAIVDEADQIEPEAEAEEPVTASAPAPETTAYVVPVAHIPAHNAMVHEPFPEVPADVLTEGENVIPVTERPADVVVAVTAETQRNPQPFDRSTLEVYSSEVNHYRPYRSGHGNPDGETEIERAATHLGFLTDRDGVVVKRFDRRVYAYSAGAARWVPGNGHVTDIHVTHKPKTAPKLSFTAEEYEEAVRTQKAEVLALVESGDVVALQGTSTYTRKYKLDANRTENPRIKTANATAFRQAINSGKAVVIPVDMEKLDSGLGSRTMYVDDQGFNTAFSWSTHVSGQVMVRRNAEGVMEVLSNERSLKCSCSVYREKYYCEHVNYVQRHVGNLAQQMLPDPNAARAARAARPEGTHRLMTAALLARGDARVNEPEGQEPYVSFTNANGTRTERVRSSYSDTGIRSRLIMPAHLQPANPQALTPDELTNMGAYNITAKELVEVSTPTSPAGIRTALRRSDVDLPVSARFRRSGNSWNSVTGDVSGIIRYKKADDPANTEAVHSSLECTCADYVRNHDCQHVRIVKDQHLAILGAGSRAEASPEQSLSSTMSRHRYAMEAERETIAYMARYNVRRSGVEAHRANTAAREAEESRQRLERRQAERRRIEEDMIRRRREQAEGNRLRNQSTVEEHNAYRERMKQRWETVDEKYSDNPKAFYEEYKAALSRKRAGEEAIPFRTENVTDGICADEPGARSFGVELEFDISDGVDRREALRKIGRELHAAGLTERAEQTGYHSAQHSGWAKWSFEEDCTVSGELVSPIMKDTPEHWEQLRVATEIITRNGGIATRRTGSHVHVSTGSYEQSTAKHAELLRTVNNNEDLMYRLASNPKTGKHRGGQWCQPNADDEGAEFISAEVQDGHNVLGYNTSHGYALNYEGTANPEYRKSHVEFRMWDGTLDPAVIQQQVMISAALTDHAERNVINNGGSTKPAHGERVRMGAGKRKDAEELAKASTQTHTEETFKESSAKAAEFFDKLFRRKEDRAVAASLFAVTNWQE